MSNVCGTTPVLKPRQSARSAWLLSLVTAMALGAMLVWHPAPPPRYAGLSAVRARIPAQTAGYHFVGDNPVSEPVRKALAAADLLSRAYRNDVTGQAVDFTLIGGTDRSSLHDPRSCLTGAGWRIEDDHVETIPGTETPIRVCRVLPGNAGGMSYEALYLYVVDGKTINQVTEIRSEMLLSALIGRKNKPVCFVRFMRPLLTDPAADAASHRQFRDFVGQMWTTIRLAESQTKNASSALLPFGNFTLCKVKHT